MSNVILSARGLTRQFKVRNGLLAAVNSIDLDVGKNETLALVGESGSGKTTLSRLLLLLDEPTSGDLSFNGKSTGKLSRVELQQFRRAVQAVFQNPFSSLNPRMRVKHIVAEPLRVQGELSQGKVDEQVVWALQATGLQAADGEKFPHQFSGGQRQRVAIARAIVSRPELIILDEPVSSQDISIQAQILNLLKELQQQLGVSYLFIAHDLATVRFMSDRVAVMYLGKIVETGASEDVFENPRHPYTQALFASVLPETPDMADQAAPALGEIPSPLNPPGGCSFHPRCSIATELCRRRTPVLEKVGRTQSAACIYAERIEEVEVHE